jgi:hypothetical protein
MPDARQGMELEVTEADLKKAERDGHAPDLPPITLDHHQRARDMVHPTRGTLAR